MVRTLRAICINIINTRYTPQSSKGHAEERVCREDVVCLRKLSGLGCNLHATWPFNAVSSPLCQLQAPPCAKCTSSCQGECESRRIAC